VKKGRTKTKRTTEDFLEEFREENERIAPMEMCLCVLQDGSHRILPITPKGKFLAGEVEVEAVWFCKATSATKLIGQLFSQKGSDTAMSETIGDDEEVPCAYEPGSNVPCDSCPRKITMLYRCGVLKEMVRELNPGVEPHEGKAGEV
jgi:hypothetical protein